MDLNVEVLEEIIRDVLSTSVNLRKKLKLYSFEDELLIRSEKPWFVKRGLDSVRVDKFFELIFKEAYEKNRLDFSTKTVSFDKTDAEDLGVESETKIHILEFFKMIPELK